MNPLIVVMSVFLLTGCAGPSAFMTPRTFTLTVKVCDDEATRRKMIEGMIPAGQRMDDGTVYQKGRNKADGLFYTKQGEPYMIVSSDHELAKHEWNHFTDFMKWKTTGVWPEKKALFTK